MFNFFKKKEKKFRYTTADIANHTSNGDRITSWGNTTSQSVEGYIQMFSDLSSSTEAVSPVMSETKKEQPRKVVNPVDVFKEIKEITPEISFENLEEKIAVVKERIKILSEHLDKEHLKDEMRCLFYLENRFKYLKTRKKNPFDWALTTREAVDDLCKRYSLKVVPLKQYYTTVPKEGVQEIDRYTNAYKVVAGDNPIFELIIKDTSDLPKEEAKKTTKKDRDPILLANSPFGNFLMILGAWDDEVEVVDEIIYNGK